MDASQLLWEPHAVRTPKGTEITEDQITSWSFDPNGVAQLCVQHEGPMHVSFNFTPPHFAEEHEQRLAAFREQLERAIGVPVEQADRVWFMIRTPAEDTIERANGFLERFRVRQRR
jgi:hypothetical protein